MSVKYFQRLFVIGGVLFCSPAAAANRAPRRVSPSRDSKRDHILAPAPPTPADETVRSATGHQPVKPVVSHVCACRQTDTTHAYYVPPKAVCSGGQRGQADRNLDAQNAEA